MLEGMMETSASFEARSAPSSYSTISLSGSGEGPGWETGRGYSTTPLPASGGWLRHRALMIEGTLEANRNLCSDLPQPRDVQPELHEQRSNVLGTSYLGDG